MKRGPAAVVMAAAFCAVASIAAQRPAPISGFDPATFDTSVRPQDDLYRYVNGRWMDSTPIPDDRVSFSASSELTEKTNADIRAIIEELAAQPNRRAGSREQQVVDLYASMLDEAAIEARGAAPIEPELRAIDAVDSVRALADRAGRLSAETTAGPFFATVGLDPRNAGDRLVNLSQGGLLLDRDNYLGAEPRAAEIRAEYQRYLARIFTLTRRADPVGDAAAVLSLETEIARAHVPQPPPPPAPMSISQMMGTFPGFDWPAWARPQGVDRVAGVVVLQPEFFRSFAALVPQRPMATWRAWLAARYITALSPYLNKDISDSRFDFFGTFLTGQRVVIPRWKRGVSLVNTYLGDAVGRVYVERHFPRSSRERVERIVNQVVRAFKQSVLEQTWMSASARVEAHDKLMALSTRVGFPDVWKNYRGLDFKPDDLVGNLTRGAAFDNARRMHRLARPEERGEWLATPQLVNAYYVPRQNEIVLPAAILQPPYFDAAADDAVNYGAIGAVIGHEIGHGLDHEGRWYTATGAMRDWWQAQDVAAYATRVQPVLDQLSLAAERRSNPQADGYRLNGMQVLAESVGDVAGLAVAHRAYRMSLGGRPAPVIDGLTGDQRFFLGWARIWRAKDRPEFRRQFSLTSRYAPPDFRANATAGQIDAFYEAFSVSASDALFVPPARRARLY
ncbi:MAG TPA: M13 family metallopeptidase [Vicinamibacterales bacterium]|nr:M13 family metallopeptidase [Vicinamibacterales bacterium]